MAGTGVPARVGGRPPLIAVSDIVSAGRELGMRNLSINAVAARLGVSATALYRHISGRWELERLVGESLLAELEFVDDPARSVEDHLLAFGVSLHRFTLDNPGLATYMQVLFPRGEAGAQLLTDEIAALGRRGYTAEGQRCSAVRWPCSRSGWQPSTNSRPRPAAATNSWWNAMPPPNDWPVTRRSGRCTRRVCNSVAHSIWNF